MDYKEEKVIAEVSGSTVGECLDYLVRQQASLKTAILDKNGDVRFGNLVRINGEYIYFNILDRPVKDEDQIEIIKFSGGC